MILTVSRMEAEKKANPGYRTFLANGYNVTRALALFFWEVVIEWTAALRGIRRDVVPRGHRGGMYPFLRAAVCIVVRDVIVYGVLTDMLKGRPAIYATFSSYDEVAHHSGLERADTMEALRKLDGQFGRIDRARRYRAAPVRDRRPLRSRTDAGRDVQAAQRLRSRRARAPVGRARRRRAASSAGDENDRAAAHAFDEATGRAGKKKRPKNDVSDQDVVVLGSGNLGLVYLMEERRRLTREEIDERHPRLLPALREHPHVGWVLVHSSEHGAVVLGANGTHYLADGRVEGEDPLALFSPSAPQHLLRADGFEHAADVTVGSFYDPALEEGCAFEELISFHGGLGGPQTRPFLLYPVGLAAPPEPLVGAAAVHRVLVGWRSALNGTCLAQRLERHEPQLRALAVVRGADDRLLPARSAREGDPDGGRRARSEPPVDRLRAAVASGDLRGGADVDGVDARVADRDRLASEVDRDSELAPVLGDAGERAARVGAAVAGAVDLAEEVVHLVGAALDDSVRAPAEHPGRRPLR